MGVIGSGCEWGGGGVSGCWDGYEWRWMWVLVGVKRGGCEWM